MLESIIDTIDSLGYVGIALLMALENLIPPIPSELIMPLAGFTVTQGKMNFILVAIAGTIGSVLGATPWYFLGKYWGLNRTKQIADRYGKWLTLSGEDVVKAKVWFDRRGYTATAIGRLIPGIRTYISLPAGISKMPLVFFLIYSAIGTIFWVSFLTGAGYIFGANYEQVGMYLKPISTIVLIGIFSATIYWVIKRKVTS
ncbi:Alkaline phosphatase-like protein [Hyella patelloides LEGE 07179]|uniref:Alkaline phosphatase-like protein n=1 Tax=Hyella patelloides LEGE 07179 TaxID=945734 RepID=A0A563VR05_9CYAN|nr:DedA family protein [Hyella patelloides]VEP13898.1 Alkaline phosphatase-like protein [Hyella patelloides LEGE 07179]